MAKSDDSRDTAQPWQSYHTVYTNAKAGMEGVDKEKVQRIVYEMSKGSKFFENEERKEAFIKQKIENMRARCEKLSASDLSCFQKVADRRILELEATRDLSRIWLHVDMDAFYAAVETLSNPSLKGKPMAVGGMSMICTANYEARRFGVRAAMPGFIARRLCPKLIFVPTDFKKYTHYSDLTRKVFRRYDPNFIAASLDEAYLDITEVCKERGISSEEIAEELRASVHEETGLTCSAGVAPNRLLSKVCSDINKPNGQFVLPNDRAAIMTFISSLPIRKIGGIGKVTEHILRDALGIKTCEEILQKGGYLCALFSHTAAATYGKFIQRIGRVISVVAMRKKDEQDILHSRFDFFLSVGLGLGSTDSPEARLRKSISNERTFPATEDEKILHQRLADLAENLSTDMQKEGLRGRTLTLKLKTASFEVRTRAVTLQKFICSSVDILHHASKLFKAELPLSLRLIGLRVSQFNEDTVGSSADPTQRTLTRFIASGDALRKNEGEKCTLGLDASNQQPKDGTDSGLLFHDQDTELEFGASEDSVHFTNVNDSHCTFNEQAWESEKLGEPSSSFRTDEVKSHNLFLDGPETSESSQTDTPSLGLHESSHVDRMNVWSSSMDSKTFLRPEQVFGVDDYKCSLCGFELPPSFVQERQEHTDFHIAEKLQGESGIQQTALLSRQRITHDGQHTRERHASERKRKRQKPSPKEGRHLPIDMFFVKGNH